MIKKIKSWIYSSYKIFLFSTGKAKVYHSGKNKSKITIAIELFKWLGYEGRFNLMYYAFGLNIAGTRQSDYIGRKKILFYKNKTEKQLKQTANCTMFNYDVITKDKFYANSVFKSNNISCVEDQALISNSQIIFNNGEVKNLDSIYDFHGQIFIKNTVLEAGDGVLVCHIENRKIHIRGKEVHLDELRRKLDGGKWVVQFTQRSHPQIRKINSSSLNTTRVVTILNEGEPTYLTGFQSFATNYEKTDSWDKGSIYVGIDIQNNCLKKYGYYHPEVGKSGLVDRHPDSGIIFEGYEIDELQNAVKLCIRAHKILYFNFIVGWDVALTDKGPMILEANEKPGMNAVQCADGGLYEPIKGFAEKIFSS